VVRVHGSGRAQDGFGIQTKQGQLLLPCRDHHSRDCLIMPYQCDYFVLSIAIASPDLSGLLYPLLVILGSVANLTLVFFQLQYQSPYLIRVHVSVPAWL